MNSNRFWEGHELVELLVQKGLPSQPAKRVGYLLRDGQAHEALGAVFTHVRYRTFLREGLRAAREGSRAENSDTELISMLGLATIRATNEKRSLQAALLRK
jgi:hypothetical protein